MVYTMCFGCLLAGAREVAEGGNKDKGSADSKSHAPAIQQASKDSSVLVASRIGKVPDVGPSPRIGLLLIWD